MRRRRDERPARRRPARRRGDGRARAPGCTSARPPRPSRCPAGQGREPATTCGSTVGDGGGTALAARAVDLRRAAATCRRPRESNSAATARLVLREEQVLGRAGEQPGRLTSRLTVRRDGRTAARPGTGLRPGAPGGWDGPPCSAGHRAVGQLLVVGRSSRSEPVAARLLGRAGRRSCRSPAPPSWSPPWRRTPCGCGGVLDEALADSSVDDLR